MKAFSVPSRLKIWLLFGLSAITAVVGPACSGSDRPGLLGGLAGDGVVSRDSGAPCQTGAQKPCGVTLDLAAGVKTCYRGTQFCVEGAWSNCQAGEVTREPNPIGGFGFDPAQRQALGLPSLSMPAHCGNGHPPTGSGGASSGGSSSGGGPNTADFATECDPECMFFGENPTDITGNGGADPGPLPTVTAPTCEHGACTVGAKMTSNCDPCVASVCAAHPSCCTTAWTGQCVDWATQTCVGVTLPKTLCDFGLFSDTNLELSDRAATNVAIGAYGNVKIGADSYFTSIYATGNVTTGNFNSKSVTMTDGIHANGYIKFEASDTSKVYGNLYAGNYVDINNVDIQGDVWATGTGTAITGAGSNGIITGTARSKNAILSTLTVGTRLANQTGLTLPAILLPPQTAGTAIPTKTTDCTGTTDYLNQATRSIGPGKYGTITINDGASNYLELKGQGVYYIKALKLGNSNRLILNLNDETYAAGWDVRICNTVGVENLFYGKVRVSGDATKGPPNDSNGVLKDPKYLTIYYAGTATLKMDTDVYWTGILMAPNASVEKSTMNLSPGAPLANLPTTNDINLGNRAAPVNGAIWSKTTKLETDALARGIDPDVCKAMPQIVLPPVTCPVTLAPKGLQNEPCVSGRDCQANSHCLGPTTTSCAHDKCTTSPTPLSAGCDDCVARICAVPALAGCCSTAWGQNCVDAVATQCDATCAFGTCSQNACVAGPQPIDKHCDDDLGAAAGCLDTVCAANPTCCQSGGAWSATCVTALNTACGSLATGKTRLCDYAIFASDEYVKSGTPTISSGLVNTASMVDPDPAVPTVNFNCAAGTASHYDWEGSLMLNAATHYDEVEMGWGETLRFPAAGKYYMNYLYLGGDNAIQLPAAPAVVEVYVCGQVYVGEQTVVTGLAAGADSMRFRVYSNYNGSNAIWWYRDDSGGRQTYGAMYAPNGSIRLGGNLTHNGLLWGEDVILGSNDTINYPGAAETACEAAPIDAGAVCPLTLIPKPAMASGQCEDNTAGYKDSSCIGYDLAAGIPCDKKVPICNHGTAQFSGSVSIGYYSPSKGQLAVENPAVAPDGTCPQTLTIPAGECRDLTNCTALAAGQTIMIDPLKALTPGECGGGTNGRRLDNWTAYDGRTCVPQSQPNRVEYEYEAKCPDGSSARWGLLTWSTTTPGSSHIDFSVKVGADSEELATANFAKIAEASQALNSQVCVFKSATPCYADITAKLSLSPKEPARFLNLRADVVPNGGSPVLKDWGISYTCVYDQ
jgi:hypothetical protein